MFHELNTLHSFSGLRWIELDRETRVAILACQKATEQIRQEIRDEFEAERKTEEDKRKAKQKMTDDIAMRAAFREQGASAESIRGFMNAGEDG